MKQGHINHHVSALDPLQGISRGDDIVRRVEPGGGNTLVGVLILVVWLYGTLVLAERRSGHVILLLG